jgi:hypothetical protein
MGIWVYGYMGIWVYGYMGTLLLLIICYSDSLILLYTLNSR